MVSKSKKLVIGFFPPHNKLWMGGVNYYCNLFYALNALELSDYEIVVFLCKNTSSDVVKLYEGYQVKVVKTAVLERWSIAWFADKLLHKFFGTRYMLNRLLSRHHVSIISHVQADMGVNCKVIAWLPDFQHVHLPHMFPQKDLSLRNHGFSNISNKADAVILSSYDALNDFKNFVPTQAHKGRVAQFVSQLPSFYSKLSEKDRDLMLLKYGIDRPYVFVPNQFWRHKNHELMLEAVNILKKSGNSPLVVCSGLMEDSRDPLYVSRLLEYVEQNNLADTVRFLGLIPYEDVFTLIKFSDVVLNPSRFEGWSSAVEECKSAQKQMILSDIAVHKEQYPEAIFFNVNSAASLAEKLALVVNTVNLNADLEHLSVSERTKRYASTYISICSAVLNG